MLLDEPTAHLDFGHRVRAFDVLARRARERGQALLAVLHDLNLAALADRIVLLVHGGVAAAGKPPAVLRASTLADAFGVAVDVVAPGAGRPPFVVPRPRVGPEG